MLTGEAGVGKTTLRRSLESERSVGNRWMIVDVTPQTSVQSFYTLIRRGLGLRQGSFGRTELADVLGECSLDSQRWTLAIDEAQNLDDVLLEEIRVLSNMLREPEGFEAILLVGQTSLARRISNRDTSAFCDRVASHVHLRPLDADEVGRLLQSIDPARDWPVDLVDRIHLLSYGRPAKVVSLASLIVVPRPGLRRPSDSDESASLSVLSTRVAPPAATPRNSPYPEPLVGPPKPPIREEDGLIEVGWEPDSDDELSLHDDSDLEVEGSSDDSVEGEERINDHYAALQAWQEWATNQGRHPEASVTEAVVPEVERLSPLAENPNLWADEEHEFAPVSRLFTRLKQENQVE